MLPIPQRRFLLGAPLVALPFLCAMFYGLGGGKGVGRAVAGHVGGLNTELPGAFPDPRKTFLDKMGAYLKADRDSLRKKEYAQQDPYHPFVAAKAPDLKAPDVRAPDPKATELLTQLNRLKQSLQEPQAVRSEVEPVREPVQRSSLPGYSPPAVRPHVPEGLEKDPQLERLDNILDKVIRIQHPSEARSVSGQTAVATSEAVIPADSASNAIAAVIPSDQTLITGGTIPLRLSEDILVHGVRILAGGWVYGTATINGDRLQVHIRSIRDGRNLYNSDLQVYDLDGLPGVHIPDVLSQDVAKESATESVSGLNILTTDPGLGAEAASAGVQAAKSLLTHKARLIKVSVRAGYEVLLKNSNNNLPIRSMAVSRPAGNQLLVLHINPQPPGFVPGGSFLERSRAGGVGLKLQGIYLKDSLLWFGLEWENHSPIGFAPEYYRWVLRDRRTFRRTAQQEMAVEPSCAGGPVNVLSDSMVTQWAGFRPFVPGKDKELVLEVGEKNGGRVLTLVVHPKQILNAKIIQNEKAETIADPRSEHQCVLYEGGVRGDNSPVQELDLPDFQ